MHQQPSQELLRGRIISYDGYRGTISSQFENGNSYDIPLFRDCVLPLPPNLNICVGQEVQYNLHRPRDGNYPYANNVQIITPQLLIPPAHASAPGPSWTARQAQPRSGRGVAKVEMPSTDSTCRENQMPLAPAPHPGEACRIPMELQHRTNAAPSASNTVVGAKLPATRQDSMAKVLADAMKVSLPGSSIFVASKGGKDSSETAQIGTSGHAADCQGATCWVSRGTVHGGSSAQCTSLTMDKWRGPASETWATNRHRGWWPPANVMISTLADKGALVKDIRGNQSALQQAPYHIHGVYPPLSSYPHPLPRQPPPPPPYPPLATYPPPRLPPDFPLPPLPPGPSPLPPDPPLPPLPPGPPPLPPDSPLPPLPPGPPPPDFPPPPPPPPRPSAQLVLPPPLAQPLPEPAPGSKCLGNSYKGALANRASGPVACNNVQQHGTPQYAPLPPVPHLHLNMPYMDRAACQPLPEQQRRTDIPREVQGCPSTMQMHISNQTAYGSKGFVNDRQGRLNRELGRHDRYEHMPYDYHRNRDRDVERPCYGRDYSLGGHSTFRESSKYRPDQANRNHSRERREHSSERRSWWRSRGDNSPARHGMHRQRGIQVDNLGRKAAAVAVAHVRHLRRSSLAAELPAPELSGTARATVVQRDGKTSGDAKAAASGGKVSASTTLHPLRASVTMSSGPSGVQNSTAAAATTEAAALTVIADCKPPPGNIDLSRSSDSDVEIVPYSHQADSETADNALPGSCSTLSGEVAASTDSDVEVLEDGEVPKKKAVEKSASRNRKIGGKSSRRTSSSRSSKASAVRRAKTDIVAELEKALARVSLSAKPVPGAANIRLFCGHCGKEQEWDVAGERARPLLDESAPDGIKRTKDAGRVLYDAKKSTCSTCGNMIMCNPMSATCIYCDCQLDGFRPSYWKCSNIDGKARKRVLSGPSTSRTTAAGRASSSASAVSSAELTTASVNLAGGGKKSANSGALTTAAAGVPPVGCPYSRTCMQCKDHDLRFRGRPRCSCPRFHGAIAGQVSGNRAGNFGWVNVH